MLCYWCPLLGDNEFYLSFRDEVSQVEKYLELLLKQKKGELRIQAKDIGIISPYRKQVFSYLYCNMDIFL